MTCVTCVRVYDIYVVRGKLVTDKTVDSGPFPGAIMWVCVRVDRGNTKLDTHPVGRGRRPVAPVQRQLKPVVEVDEGGLRFVHCVLMEPPLSRVGHLPVGNARRGLGHLLEPYVCPHRHKRRHMSTYSILPQYMWYNV